MKWGETRKKNWNDIIKQMNTNRLVRIAIEGKPSKLMSSTKDGLTVGNLAHKRVGHSCKTNHKIKKMH